jgi:sigma-B regulation protein RsbU (phosphoserine phosphatase)
MSSLHLFRPDLLERRSRLQAASASVSPEYLNGLIAEIDTALARIDTGGFGLCEVCHGPIEPDRLEQNPLVRFCLDHLTQAELRAHQQDLDLAAEIQRSLLPRKDVAADGWDAQYRYVPAGAVGGDYCEVAALSPGSLFFAVGDVSGKGVAASLLMTHLSAILRSLLSLDLTLKEMVVRANRLFCESTAPAQYATLVCGRASASGVEFCNAGHCPPMLVQRNGITTVESTGLPLGLFCDGQYEVRRLTLDKGDSLALYSDGITEARNPGDEEYGEERLIHSLREHLRSDPGAVTDAVLRDVVQFLGNRPLADDMTLLVLRREH